MNSRRQFLRDCGALVLAASTLPLIPRLLLAGPRRSDNESQFAYYLMDHYEPVTALVVLRNKFWANEWKKQAIWSYESLQQFIANQPEFIAWLRKRLIRDESSEYASLKKGPKYIPRERWVYWKTSTINVLAKFGYDSCATSFEDGINRPWEQS
jgi:hypothetical protein